MSSIKRLADLILAMIALPVALPLGVILAICVRLSGPGPVLLRLDVMGCKGRVFGQYRFRSVNIDARARHFKAKLSGSDTTIETQATAIGRFMIQTELNCLPQLLNIIKGDMSFFVKCGEPVYTRVTTARGL